MKLDWRLLYYGRVSPREVQEAVNDMEWQKLRLAMKGGPLEMKYAMLRGYQITKSEAGLDAHEWRMVEVRITNYVTALSREGLIKPSDYR